MRRITILAIMLIVFTLVGCQGGGTTSESTPFIGGTNGVLQSFIQGAPPDEVFDDSQLDFSIITQLENVGESDIEEGAGYIKIHGILAQDYGLTAADLKKDVPALRGAKKNVDQTITNGDMTTVEFTGLKFLGSVPGTIQAGPIRIEACYDYETKATAQLCIRERLTTERGRELCEPSGQKEVANSGAPLHLTNLVEQPLSSGKVQITFQIESVGQQNDRFYKDGTDCNDDLTNRNRFRVHVDVSDVSGVVPNCQLEENNGIGGQGYKTLWNGRPQTVTCTLDFGEIEASFRPIVNMKLKYRYSQYIEKGLLVKDISVA